MAKCIPKVASASSVAAGFLCASAAFWPALAQSQSAIPIFSPDATIGWQLTDDEFIAPESGPGPVKSDAAHPYVSFYKFPTNPRPTFRVADLSNPILLPWAREELRQANEKSLSGKVIAIPKERCWPVGVPAFSLLPATPVYFLQTPKVVTLIWTQNHQVRRVYLDVPHSANVKPSWYGESIGHYEGDTLIIDTIGLNTKTYIDNYFTPHTEQLHVVERYRMIEDGKTLEVNLHVEDPGAFTTPWNAIQRYRRNEAGPMAETVCAENNDDHFHHNIGPVPTAERPDF
jgi:hypothetical protein